MSGAGGLFVTFEGVDGGGKSTQLRRIAERLRDEGRDVTLTREPGGSPGAEEIRALLVDGSPDKWSAEAELLLFTAARRDHWERTIAPALADGRMVLCDRFVDSTRAYQSAGRGAPREMVETLHQLAIGREADLTLIFDLDPEVAAARGVQAAEPKRPERFEGFGLEFQRTLRRAFLDIAADAPKRCRVIDAAQETEAVTTDALAAIGAALSERAP